jgi:hypothetical protein
MDRCGEIRGPRPEIANRGEQPAIAVHIFKRHDHRGSALLIAIRDRAPLDELAPGVFITGRAK